ncbi:hypothetical protein [Amycolatopsis kentuckyensis]|uniref:hypothetical protein n=1 Tax=Amycolatopsis kentuckyensis TaxID=218823 RepID=UPI0035654B21
MTDDMVRPDMKGVPHLMEILRTCWASWAAVQDAHGSEVAGDPFRDMATAVVLAGYKRVTE